jgi:ABC-type nitrate/sulfonate/bicarbonate transport system substrate-binding protein
MVFVVKRSRVQQLGPTIQRFLTATGRAADLVARTPALGVDTLMKNTQGMDRGFQLAAIRATRRVWSPSDRRRPFGWQDPAAWRAFGDWMVRNHLLNKRPDPGRAMTNAYLPDVTSD